MQRRSATFHLGKHFCAALLALSASIAAGCGGGDTTADAGPLGGAPYQVQFETSKGIFVVEVNPEWAPIGAAHFRELVDAGYYDGNRFFRIVPGFVVQFGLNGDPAVTSEWVNERIDDDDVVETNSRGLISFAATSQRDSRTTQLFINLGNNFGLDSQGFAPFARVISGMDVVDSLNYEYREQPDQAQIVSQGNSYLETNFPNLDYIVHVTVL